MKATASVTVVEKFCSDFEKVMEETGIKFKKNADKVKIDEVFSFHERFGICTHQQYYLLLLETDLKLANLPLLNKTHLIINSIVNNEHFQKAAFYWADVQRHVQYRFKINLNNSQELTPVIKKAMAMRLTDMQPETKLAFMCLGWMMWLEGVIPYVQRLSNGHLYYGYWDKAPYFTTFYSSLQEHVTLLKQAIANDLKKMKVKNFNWHKQVAHQTLEDMIEYHQLIFGKILNGD